MNHYLSPEEILLKYPDLESKLQWGKDDLGFFLRNKLVRGYYSRNKRKSLIEETSLLSLIAFANKNLEEQKVIL
jgi:hypothetical protein